MERRDKVFFKRSSSRYKVKSRNKINLNHQTNTYMRVMCKMGTFSLCLKIWLMR